MLRESLGSIDGVVDVGILVVAHFVNPIRISALKFLKRVLKFEIRALIPVTAFIGAYHILTNYLKIPRKEAADALKLTLNVRSKAIYEDVSRTDAIQAIEYAMAYKIESWDGYIVSLARKFGSNIIYTLDEKLSKVEGVYVVNPIPKEELAKYHEFLKKLR